MLSPLELRHVIESAFFPTLCKCEISVDGIVSISLTDPESRDRDYTAAGIHISELATSRAIASMVMVLKEEARLAAILKNYHQSRMG